MIDSYFFVFAILLLASVGITKISDKFGIPVLLLFMLVGMLAGAEGFGGIILDNPSIVQAIGMFALANILFAGGLDTRMENISVVLKEAIALSTVGVLISALLMGLLTSIVFNISILEGVLIGAITSSTDAAAVFSLLRSRGVKLKKELATLLELESIGNDPMAILFTMGILQLSMNSDNSPLQLVLFFFQQVLIGGVMGILAGKILSYMLSKITLAYDGLFSVLVLGVVIFTFSATNLIRGSGFLAVYIAGLLLGTKVMSINQKIPHFFEGLSWLMQVIMFLALGLFVIPSRLFSFALPALFLALALMFVIRPLSVWVCLLPFHLNIREKVLTSWVGLRGAVPILLAIYPRIAGLASADLIFNLVFIIVLISVLIQGTSIPWLAKMLHLEQ